MSYMRKTVELSRGLKPDTLPRLKMLDRGVFYGGNFLCVLAGLKVPASTGTSTVTGLSASSQSSPL